MRKPSNLESRRERRAALKLRLVSASVHSQPGRARNQLKTGKRRICPRLDGVVIDVGSRVYGVTGTQEEMELFILTGHPVNL